MKKKVVHILEFREETQCPTVIYDVLNVYSSLDLAISEGINKHIKDGCSPVRLEDLKPRDESSLSLLVRVDGCGCYLVTPMILDGPLLVRQGETR